MTLNSLQQNQYLNHFLIEGLKKVQIPIFASKQKKINMQCTTRYLKLIDLESTFSKQGNNNVPYKIPIAYVLSLHNQMKIVASTWISISSIFDKCSMLQQTESPSNYTSYRNFHFNEFVANVLCDNMGSQCVITLN